MLLGRLDGIIKGKYEIRNSKGIFYERGDQFKANGLTGWLEVESIQASEDCTIIIVKC